MIIHIVYMNYKYHRIMPETEYDLYEIAIISIDVNDHEI